MLWAIGIILGVGAVIGYTKSQKPKIIPSSVVLTQIKPTAIPSSTFSIETPPSESLQGSISARLGTLLWESRIATEPSELTTDVKMKQGERLLTTAKSSAVITFDKLGSISLSENSDLSFIQTLPIDFVVQQKSGSIVYELNDTTPLSIRIRNALITKTSGKINVSMADGDSVIVISTLEGTAQIGFNDVDIISQVFTLREGQVYEYNSDERTAINQNNQ